jgi:4-hydroxymandelate oxidase
VKERRRRIHRAQRQPSARHDSTLDTRTPAEPPVNLIEYETHARALLSPSAYAYVAGASAQEISNRANRERFDEIRLAPRVLRDVSHVDTTLELFGRRLEFPVLLAPAAFHKLMHSEAELATVRGANAAEALLVASTLANTRIEDMGAAAGHPLWFQLYVQRDRGATESMIRRARRRGAVRSS